MLHQFNIIIHVIAGTLGLIIGIIPFITKKGGKTHILYGRVFLALISISILTAFNGVLFFRDRPFLTVITLLSLYQTVSGYRAIKYKEKGPGGIDLLIVLSLLCAELIFIYKMQEANIVWHGSVIYFTLIYMSLFLAYDFLRIVKLIKGENLWLIEHIIKMTGAYSALFTAAAGTVLWFWEPYNQIISAALSNVLLASVIFFYLFKWRKTFHRNVNRQTQS